MATTRRDQTTEPPDELAADAAPVRMRAVLQVFSLLHAALALLFALAALLLVGIAVHAAWTALGDGIGRGAAQQLIEAMGLLAAAVGALQIAQTIAEEEVIRNAHVSGPTRVRRFLSRFLVVVGVALAIECLVAAFRAAHEDPTLLRYAAGMVLALGGLLAGWGVFISLNRHAEELEPEAMREAKGEDKKLT